MSEVERIVIEGDCIYREEVVYQLNGCYVKKELLLTKDMLKQALREWNIIKPESTIESDEYAMLKEEISDWR